MGHTGTKLTAVVAALILWCSVGVAAQKATEISFRLVDGWAILVKGTLGGLPHQNLLIDTGAVPSAINSRVARKLGLRGLSSQLSLINRSIAIETVVVPDVQLGPVGVAALPMAAMDLGRIEQALATRIDAVVGLDLLANQNFSIDYRRKRLDFDRVATVGSAIEFETKQEAGGTYILISLADGNHTIKALVDTGTKDLMLFEQQLKGNLRLLDSRRQERSLNAGGTDHLSEVEMPSVRLGPLSWRKQKAYLWRTPEDQLPEFDALLGPAALGIAVVGFDFNRYVMWIETR